MAKRRPGAIPDGFSPVRASASSSPTDAVKPSAVVQLTIRQQSARGSRVACCNLHIRRRIVWAYVTFERGARLITGSKTDGNLQMMTR